MEKNERICPNCGAKLPEGNTCVYCGTQITVSETESTSQIIKSKESSELTKLRTLAHRAQEANENEDAHKYFDMILIQDPNDWEAYFYTKFYKVGSGRIGDIPNNVSNLIKCFKPTFSIIKDTITDDKEIEENILKILTHVENLAINLLNNIIIFTTSDQSNNVPSDFLPYPIVLLDSLGDEIQSSFDKKYFALAVMCWKRAIGRFDGVISTFQAVYGANFANQYYGLLVMRLSVFDGRSKERMINKIRKFDPSFLVAEEQEMIEFQKKRKIAKTGIVTSIIALVLSVALMFLIIETDNGSWFNTVCIMILISFISMCGFLGYKDMIGD